VLKHQPGSKSAQPKPDYNLPRTEEAVVMVDFIRDVREFQAYLDRKHTCSPATLNEIRTDSAPRLLERVNRPEFESSPTYIRHLN
jgi:hypothetical protein